MTISARLLKKISRRYKQVGNPIAFSSPATVARELGISVKDAKEALEHLNSYTLHREYKRPRKFNPYYIYRRRELMQADLIDIRKLRLRNGGIQYLLLIIDVFSRRVWLLPIKNKTATVMHNVFSRWIQRLHQKPKVLCVDGGSEFWNRQVRNLMAENGIDLQLAVGTSKAAYAERANKSIQILLYKYMSERGTNRYIDVLSEIARTYNERGHRSLQYMSPLEADTPHNELLVRDVAKTRFARIKRRKPRFSLGDVVRLKTNPKGVTYGNRAYAPQFREEYYMIWRMNNKIAIPLYFLMAIETRRHIKGGFYAEEMQRVRGDIFKIERELQRRRRADGRIEVLVKWKYFGSDWNTWILEDNIRRG